MRNKKTKHKLVCGTSKSSVGECMTGAVCGCSNARRANQQLNSWERLKEPVVSLLTSTGELRCIIPALSAPPTSLRPCSVAYSPGGRSVFFIFECISLVHKTLNHY